MASPATAAANCDPHEQFDHAGASAYAVCAVMVVPIRAHHLVIMYVRLHRESKEEA